MQRRHRLRPLADDGSNALDRTRPARRRSQRPRAGASRAGGASLAYQCGDARPNDGHPETPDLDSQPVFRSAPMNRKRCRIHRRLPPPSGAPAYGLQQGVSALEMGLDDRRGVTDMGYSRSDGLMTLNSLADTTAPAIGCGHKLTLSRQVICGTRECARGGIECRHEQPERHGLEILQDSGEMKLVARAGKASQPQAFEATMCL